MSLLANRRRTLGTNGVKSKAPVKVGKEQEVEVLYRGKASDQRWPRVMRRHSARSAAKR